MPASLLSTKLYIPQARSQAVVRPRLTNRLLAGVAQPGNVVLLSGPVGFGKTTLLSEWVSQLQHPMAWVSLDEGDNDPIRFWTYLIVACQSVQPGIGESALALFRSPQPLPNEAVPTILINDLAQLSSDLVLILDDYHVIQNQSIHAAVSFLIDHLPDWLHIVLSTRIDPPWPLARLRARNQLIEIRAIDLRFTAEEASVFLNQRMGLNLSTDDVAALEARTEGWIAGLQLAALAMQSPRSMTGRSDVAHFVKAFAGSHVYVADYLVEEVLQHQPADVQTFLLQTSILERLNAALCEAVTGRQDSQAVLMTLHRSNLFVVPLDDEGHWFRYHHLFADLLQARLRQALPTEAIATLHRHAAIWYERNGFVVEAVNHALAARDFDGAARLVEQNTYSLMTRGELTTLIQWIDALPADLTRHRPQFLLAKAWALTFAGAAEQIETLLQQIEAQIKFDSETPSAAELSGSAAAIRAFFKLMSGDHDSALALAERAEALLPSGSGAAGWSSPYTLAAHSVLPYTLGMAYRGQGQYEKAAQEFARETQMYTAPHDILIWTIATTEIAVIRRMQGRLRESSEICRRALQRIADLKLSGFGALVRLDVSLSDVLREQNRLDEAHRRVTGAIDRLRTWDMPTDRLAFNLTLLRIQESQGDFSSALATLRLAQELKATQPVFLDLARTVDLHEIRLSLLTGDVATAARLMDDLQPGTSRLVFLREQELILLARLRLAQSRPGEAATLLAPLADEAEAGDRKSALLEILAVQACAHDSQGDRATALTVLIKALALAEPEGFVRVFVDEGAAMRLLIADCRLMIEKSPALLNESLNLLPYIDRLLTAFPSIAPQTAPIESETLALAPALRSGASAGVRNQESAILVEPLTARELEILQLIAAGDSNRTIADKLVITVSAVKKHTSNIFGKLNVNSRTQAIARARQIGLLATDG